MPYKKPLARKRMPVEVYFAELGGIAALGLLAFLARVLWIWYHQGAEAAHEVISRRPSPAPSLAPPQLVAGRRSAGRSASDPGLLERPAPVRISISEHKTPAPTSEPEEDDAELGSLPGQAAEPLEVRELEQAENQRASLNSSLAETLTAVLERWRGQRNQQEESPV